MPRFAALASEMQVICTEDMYGNPGVTSGDDEEYHEDDDITDGIPCEGRFVPTSLAINERALRLEQQKAGQLHWLPSSQVMLTDMLDDVYACLEPKQTDYEARRIVIQFIDKFVKQKVPGSSVCAFGSFVMNLFTSTSDLDLSLVLGNGSRHHARNNKIHFLRKVANALYGLQNGQRHVKGIETVYRAAVPVVKFVDCKTGIECDISVENNDGVLKSEVLGMFATIDPRYRQLCFLVKAWAKRHNVNSSKNGTLNSLSICLLVAFHLQTSSPSILPPFSAFLQDLYLPAVTSSLDAVKKSVKAFKDKGFGKDNKETIPQLLASFFLKLVAVESLWEQGLCASTYCGKWISKIWPKNHIGCISVEDFADRSQNVARSVSRKEFEVIYQCLHAAVSNLKVPVSNIPDIADLRIYLFGNMKQKNRGSEPALVGPPPIERWPNSVNGRDDGWSHSQNGRDDGWSHSQNGRGDGWSHSPNSQGDGWSNSPSSRVHASHSESTVADYHVPDRCGEGSGMGSRQREGLLKLSSQVDWPSSMNGSQHPTNGRHLQHQNVQLPLVKTFLDSMNAKQIQMMNRGSEEKPSRRNINKRRVKTTKAHSSVMDSPTPSEHHGQGPTPGVNGHSGNGGGLANTVLNSTMPSFWNGPPTPSSPRYAARRTTAVPGPSVDPAPYMVPPQYMQHTVPYQHHWQIPGGAYHHFPVNGQSFHHHDDGYQVQAQAQAQTQGFWDGQGHPGQQHRPSQQHFMIR